MRVELVKWRLKRNLTQYELAAKAGLGVATVIRIERGNDTTLGTIEALAKALHVNPARLVIWGDAAPGVEAGQALTRKRPYRRRGPRIPKDLH